MFRLLAAGDRQLLGNCQDFAIDLRSQIYTTWVDRSIFVKFLSNLLLFEISRYIKEVASTPNSL